MSNITGRPWRFALAFALMVVAERPVLESGSSVTVSAAAGLTSTAPTISMALDWRVPLGAKP